MIRKSMMSTLAALLLCSVGAQAATFNFSGSIDAGPAFGESFTGQYSFEESQLTGVGFESLQLTGFELSFLTQAYLWNSSAAADFEGGVFLGLSYSHDDAGQSLVMTSGSADIGDAFLHYTPTGGIESSGSYTISAVPEPSTWTLSLAGLGALGWMARRRRPSAS